MTFSRYLRIWRELNAISIRDISKELNIPESKVRSFDTTQNNEIILQWYLDHGLNIVDYNNVVEKYENKKKKKE